jgi:hypothetical protein
MPIYVWIKVTPDGRPTKIACEPYDDIDTLQRKIKEQLSPKFDQVPRDEIIVRDASSKHPFLVDAPAPNISSGIPTFSMFDCIHIPV